MLPTKVVVYEGHNPVDEKPGVILIHRLWNLISSFKSDGL
jgi:hypothetical protein